ncbi:hypothetical protein B0T19DRAFT_11072 [Cercophora scortea]|uniref:Uncharacterized protein n=1 Tax=Cercophora scortea TaxID=314031 RepID=A0AAE0MKZ9_9PEZI|nr:hypothetical protein B0T19DRAFT_11072 [Cercophora scortea]
MKNGSQVRTALPQIWEANKTLLDLGQSKSWWSSGQNAPRDISDNLAYTCTRAGFICQSVFPGARQVRIEHCPQPRLSCFFPSFSPHPRRTNGVLSRKARAAKHSSTVLARVFRCGWLSYTSTTGFFWLLPRAGCICVGLPWRMSLFQSSTRSGNNPRRPASQCCQHIALHVCSSTESLPFVAKGRSRLNALEAKRESRSSCCMLNCIYIFCG